MASLEQSGAGPPRASATLVALRDAARLEVLLTVRPDHFRFMGGATVFPGGAVASADRDRSWERASALSPGQALAALDALGPTRPDPRAEPLRAQHGEAPLGPYVCALREAFEEVGLLLEGSGPIAALRRGDADDPARWLATCLDLGVVLPTDKLVPTGRWITPLGSPVRFDTIFFVAEVPLAWQPDPNPDEVKSCRWAAPEDALEDVAAGRAIMAPPTVATLQWLAGCDDVSDALERGPASHDAPGVLTTRLGPLVTAVLAPNPGPLTGPGTNTYVVGRDETVIIDPAHEDEDFLTAVLRAAGRVGSVLLTHRHSDHVGGAAELCARTGARLRAFGDVPAGGAPVTPLADGEAVSVPGAALTAVHTPGHASDHLCFVLDQESGDRRALFSGDTVLGEGTSMIAPPDGDMRSYLGSLQRLLGLGIDRIYPGHFRPLDHGTSVLRHYIAHRLEREKAVLSALAAGPSSPEEIVERVYAGTPEALHAPAAASVLAHLEKLAGDGRVRRRGETWELAEAP